ncbi:beta strand repeat-containing protein [Lichenibacterium ramalinae]|uniref:beta strand repeat-containing protein n=1 Tax=Lichenibacterium ramalinae TaxID=2316527 RepID=UPI0013E9FAA3|nr:hypothetical protein [Lichenibacterium ramalinae]
MALDIGALSNSGTIASAGVGATIGTGTADNAAGGTITGALDGLDATGSTVVNNLDTISGTSGTGVDQVAGTLTNGAGAVIQGATDGVDATGTTTVSNAGTILGSAASGVVMGSGSLTNAAGGTITGATNGVLDTATGTLTNAGTISASGPNGIGVNLLGGGIVIDSGVISGTDASGNPGGVAVNLGGAGNSRLVLDPGAALTGIAQAAGTNNILEFAAGTGSTAVQDIGTTITGFDNILVDAGAAADVLGAITAPGTVSLGSGASLKIGGPVSAGVTIDLSGTGTTLTLGDPTGFAGTIANLGLDDTLDLTGLGAGTTVSLASGSGLKLTTASGITSILPISVPIGASLALTPDGLGVVVGGLGTSTSVTTGTGGTGTGGTGTGGTGTGGTGTGGTGTGGTGTGSTSTSAGTTTVTTDPNGDTTVVRTTPLGATSTIALPAGSSIAYGTGAAQGDVIAIDPAATYNRGGTFTVTGHVSSLSGVGSVAISAIVDGGERVTLGTADVAADGSFAFRDKVGPHLQGFITATETDGVGATTSVQTPYSLQAGIKGAGFVAQQVLFNPDGSEAIGLTNLHRDGSSTVKVGDGGQTFQTDFFTTFLNGSAPDNTFVFNQGHGLSVVDGFRANGTDHDTISLPSADFANVADVLRNTHNTAGGAAITDPVSGDTIRIAGVSKAELKANPGDFKFHA